jgi:DNA-directed RNA polymerase omega subunit|tara:strand:- start:271 stop:534 length:264 start_codon:yes stop_codon:yes gene_type:complete
MARISNTKGIKEIGGSQFELIIAAANRARSYSADNPPLAEHFNKRGMTALREIEEGVMPIEANAEMMIQKYQTIKPKELEADPILDN